MSIYFRSAKNGIEIDFYIPDIKTAIQVCYNLENQETQKRKTSSLVKLAHTFADVETLQIVTLEEEGNLHMEDTEIEVIPLYKFLGNPPNQAL
jgi:predicted AAA+ superfamily ATPase